MRPRKARDRFGAAEEVAGAGEERRRAEMPSRRLAAAWLPSSAKGHQEMWRNVTELADTVGRHGVAGGRAYDGGQRRWRSAEGKGRGPSERGRERRGEWRREARGEGRANPYPLAQLPQRGGERWWRGVAMARRQRGGEDDGQVGVVELGLAHCQVKGLWPFSICQCLLFSFFVN